MKKVASLVVILLVVGVVLFAMLFVGCGEQETTSQGLPSDSPQGAYKLEVTANISEAVTLVGSGYYDYKDDISAQVTVKEGYVFSGWYYNETDLLSNQTTYNGKMWSQDVVLKAIVIKIPDGLTEQELQRRANSSASLSYNLTVETSNGEYGLVSLDDSINSEMHKKSCRPGQNFKVLAYSRSTERFMGWYGASGELITTNASITMTMPYFDYQLVARWGNTVNGLYFTEDGDYFSVVSYGGHDDTVVIPASFGGKRITSIGASAFADNQYLSSIVIPDSVTSIGDRAFYGCSGLTSITISDSVTSIGYRAFAFCSGLTSVTFAKGSQLTSIQVDAFEYCSGLTSVTIPDSVTSIGDSAFFGCSGLTSITIPDSVTSIGGIAFQYCSKLTSIIFRGTKAQWNAISKGGGWNDDTGAYTVHCTDGDISK